MKKTYYILLLFLIKISISGNAQILLNEVMHKPGTTTSVNQGMRRKEYAEIYNAGCAPVNIGCWVIGSANQGIQTPVNPAYTGAFQFPVGTIINPGQHIVVGGTQTQDNTAYPAADIDFDVANFIGTNTCDPNTNWLLPNGDGSIALYDNTGAVVDAIYWSLFSSPNVATDADFASNPCIPNVCGGITLLESAKQIAANNPSKITYVGISTSFDLTFSRIPDGGAWQREIAPSIVGANNCNGGTCISSTSFSITSTKTNPTCGSSNGSATVTPNPAGAYTYTWTSPAVSTTNEASGLPAGIYTVTVGQGGCTTTTVITLTNSGSPTITATQTIAASCGTANGSATVTATAGSTFTWTPSGGNSSTASGLSAGLYTVIAGISGCTTTSVIIIPSLSGPTVTSAQTLTTTCGLATGAATVNTTPASTSYTWSSGVSSTTNTASNLAAGNYTVTAGTAGCTTSTVITIGSGGAPTISSVQTLTTNCGLATGAATVNTAPSSTSYTWSSGVTSTTNTASNLAAGNYTVTAGTAGCTTSTVITIGSGGAPSISSVQTLTTACGLATGAATVNTTPASTSYTWSSGVSSTTNTASNLAAGNYTVTAGTGGCNTSTVISIGSGGAPTISSVQTLTTTCGLATGSATVNTTPTSTSYTWSSGVSSTTSTASNLAAGNYTVIAGTAGCITSTVISIASIGQPTISATQTTGENCNLSDGTANFSFSPTTSSIVWSSGISSTTNTATGLSAGNYTVTITNGACTTSTVITINPIINTFTISPNITIQQGSSTQINSSSGTSYTWTPITNLSCTNCPNPIANPDETTTYCITSFDGACTYTNCVVITVETPCIVNKNYSAPNAFSPNGDGNNDEFCIKGLSNCISSFEISIYNRWGEMIYSSTEADFCWDGKYQGVVLDPAVFVFYLKAIYIDNSELIKKGNITLLH